MRHRLFETIALVAILAGLLAGCGDVDVEGPGDNGAETHEQAVTVVPEFSISGTSALPEELHLSKLGLTISEIRLEPINQGDEAVAYSTRTPSKLMFDVERGESVKLGDPVALPRDGRYLVSVRLEPIADVVETESGASEQVIPSFSISGYVAGDYAEPADPRYDGKQSDGSPVPVPFDEDGTDSGDTQAKSPGELRDSSSPTTEWTPFSYDSRRSVFITLNEVELGVGRQVLTFDFDVHDWALELVDPLLSAIQHRDHLNVGPGGGVDVTTPLESTGHGAEALFENASVRTAADSAGM